MAFLFRMTFWMALGVVLPCALAQTAEDQAWLDAAEVRIREHRMAELKFIVLDGADRAATGAVVQVEQMAHQFELGFTLAADGPPLPECFDANAPGWRIFNAVSLHRRTGWRSLQPRGPEGFETRRVRAALTAAAGVGLKARWGNVMPGTVVDLPEWVVPLRGAKLHHAASDYLNRVVRTYGHAVTGLDLAGQPVAGRLGPALVRQLQQEADALAPGTPLNLAFDGALHGPSAVDAWAQADAAGKQFVGHAGLVLGDYLPSPLPDDLDVTLHRWGRLGLPAVIAPLEVGGAPEVGAGPGLRRAMWSLFAQPWVKGIYFDGPMPSTAGDPTAVLFESSGVPTEAGLVLEELFGKTWWTKLSTSADARGHAKARVFLGRHRVTVTLPDGSQFGTTLWVGDGVGDQSAASRTVVLQPVEAQDVTGH